MLCSITIYQIFYHQIEKRMRLYRGEIFKSFYVVNCNLSMLPHKKLFDLEKPDLMSIISYQHKYIHISKEYAYVHLKDKEKGIE